MLGETLGPYRIDAELGTGGMGAVYLAEVTGRAPGIETGTRVALKVVHAHLLADPRYVARFLREAEAGIRIEHPHVLRTIEAGLAEEAELDAPYLPRLEEHTPNPGQGPDGHGNFRSLVRQVELNDFLSGAGACVPDDG